MKIGVLLVNLGTPESPTTSSVRSYLKEFLSDPYVITLPAMIRWLLLHMIILPFRSKRSAKNYQKIWTQDGSPLLVNSQQCAQALSCQLGDGYQVVLAMRYGQPTIRSGLQALSTSHQIIVLPLYPQYALATTLSTIRKVRQEAMRIAVDNKLRLITQFYNDDRFIDAFACQVRQTMAQANLEYLVMSYHGLPVNHLPDSCHQKPCFSREAPCGLKSTDEHDCYRRQCYATSALIADRLDLPKDQYSVTFQSRLGGAKWIQPYTDQQLMAFRQQGIKRLAVVCPSFVADCLETLEEIQMRLRDQWMAMGGEALVLVPCLNDSPQWIDALSAMVMSHTTDQGTLDESRTCHQ